MAKNHLKESMLRALTESLGIVHTACLKVGISRRTHYDWLEKDKSYANAVNEIDDVALDFSESKLFENIKNLNQQAIQFHLTKKGAKRGYGGSNEIGGDNEHTTVIVLMPDGSLPPVYTEEAEVLAILPSGKKE